MRCHSSYGPIFGGGGGYDILITDKCNSNNSSFTNFPSCYNRGNGEKIVNSQESYLMFGGVPSGYNMRIDEYEVFRVEV